MNAIANKAVICQKLQEYAKTNDKIHILTSDSRGSAGLTPFANEFPDRTIEIGIAEQNLVSVAAGLAASGLQPYAASPASFLSTRSIEQIKVDVAYSKTNVKLISISAGVSYGALGMTHHSLQDIAVINAIPNMTIIAPSDCYQTAKMMDALQEYPYPVYIRVGRNAVEPSYETKEFDYEIGKAITLKDGSDLTIIAYGNMVNVALKAGMNLETKGINARIIDMHTIKPIDQKCILEAMKHTKGIITIEDHSIHGGLGGIVSQITSKHGGAKVWSIALPDEVLVTGGEQEIYDHYGLNAANLEKQAKLMMEGD